MGAVEVDHCRIVGKSLTGGRPVDERTSVSLAVLAERLERLKRADSAFARVEFSPYVHGLRERSDAVVVG